MARLIKSASLSGQMVRDLHCFTVKRLSRIDKEAVCGSCPVLYTTQELLTKLGHLVKILPFMVYGMDLCTNDEPIKPQKPRLT